MPWFLIILTGIAFGFGSVLLVQAGNPGNYGFCAACHLRDIAGALGLHQINVLQYARPEILGWVIGAFFMALVTKKFKPRGGSHLVIRFLLGAFMMIGALVFLGCPLRSILRLAGGDLNGFTGLLGFVVGVYTATMRYVKRGFDLGEEEERKGSIYFGGFIPLIVAIVLLVGVFWQLPFLAFSLKGPGSMHAPVFLSLVLGLLTGALAQKSRLCLSGGFRDWFLVCDKYLLSIYAVIFLTAFLANLAFGTFKLGFFDQPLSHHKHIWNFLAMFLVGICAVLAGGCPLRQITRSASGSYDAMMTLAGLVVGAGIAHSLNVAANSNGVFLDGKIAVVAGLIFVFILGRSYRE